MQTKVLTLYQNTIPLDQIIKGIELVNKACKSIDFWFDCDYRETQKQFQAEQSKNLTFARAKEINEEGRKFEIENNTEYKVVCLIYDAKTITPSGTNPFQLGQTYEGFTTIQIPVQWFSDATKDPTVYYPEVLAQYFLHEYDHAVHYLSGTVDRVHDAISMDSSQFSNPTAYYVWLLNDLKPYWNLLNEKVVKQYPTLKLGMRNANVSYLQRILKDKGYFKYPFITTLFGKFTYDAVVNFQRDRGLVTDGVVGNKTWAELEKKNLINALITVESGGDDFAVGDLHLTNKAYGCLQIRRPVCSDVNKQYGTKYMPGDMLGNRQLSIEVFNKYMEIYCKGKSDEYKARTWNGGPSGPKKLSTLPYWQKVKKYL